MARDLGFLPSYSKARPNLFMFYDKLGILRTYSNPNGHGISTCNFSVELFYRYLLAAIKKDTEADFPYIRYIIISGI